MNKAKSTILPFTLEELLTKEDWELKIYPANQHWLAAMRDQQSIVKGKTAVEKLMGVIVGFNEKEFGLRLPRKSCIFVAESELIKKKAADRNQAYLAYARICQKLADELKTTRDEVLELMKSPLMHLDRLDPWIDEIMEVLGNLQATDTTVATVTTIIQQRLLPTWNSNDTLVMPTALFNSLYDYFLGEQDGWTQADMNDIAVSQNSGKEMQGKTSAKAITASVS